SGTNTNALFNAQVGGVLGQNAVENNWSGSQKYRNDLLNRARQDEDKAKELLIIDKKLQKLGVIDVEPVAIYYEQCNGCADADHKYGAIRKRNDQIVSYAIQSGILNDSELSLIQEDAENRVKSLRSLGFSNYPLTAEVHAQANILDFILEERMKRDRISLSPTQQVSYILLKSGMGSSPKGIRGSNFGNLRRVTPQKSGKPSENYGTPTPPQNYKADNIGKSNLPPTTSKAPVPIVRKAEVQSGKAVPVSEARIPPSLQAVKGTTVTLAQEQRLANGELIPKGSVVTWSDNAVKVVRPDGKKQRFNSRDWEQKALPKPPKDYRDNINIGKNNPKYNQQRHEKIESHNPNRIEAIRQRNAISSAERQADALKRIQAPDRTRLPGNTLSGKLGAPREMNRSPNPSQTAEAFAIRYLGRQPTADELKKGFGMNGGNCVGCWRATTPNGTIVYRPAGYAGKDTLPTTATVEIHKNPAIRSLNNNENLKLKFPIK
ncbi:TPA: adhesin, partial [Neisseria lactamica]